MTMGTESVHEDDKSSTEISDLEQKIIRQIEYYFGNYNLCRDKFLKKEITLDDGWVPLETMVKFNRLKSLTEDFNVICEALKKSPNQLMEVNDEGTKIRRRIKVPLPENDEKWQEEIESRTLYVKGFGKNDSLDQLLDFFKEYKAENVCMRYFKQASNRTFRGSVFVTFETIEDAEKFLEKKGIKYGKIELLKERRKDYFARKAVERENYKQKKAKQKSAEKEEAEESEVNVPEPEYVSGCLLRFSNLSEDITREDINASFQPYGNVVYTDYSKGQPAGVVRFDSGVAPSVLEKLEEEDGKKVIQIGSCKAVISSIEGDEEKEYWKNIAVRKANARKRFSGQKNYGNKSRFKRSKRQRKYPGVCIDEPQPKKMKTDTDEAKKRTAEGVAVEN